jgi:TetR/AcrR family transcriptional repressor of lmrAB and yxaGH operons
MPRTRNPPPARERILLAARTLFQRRGYFAVGTAEILIKASAPKGSMYHHFPGGKQEIAVAAVQAISRDMLAMLQEFEGRHICVADMVRELAGGMVRWLRASKWREGTILSSTATGAVPDLPQLHAAIEEAFDQWRKRLIRLLIAEGWHRAEARGMADLTIAATEGAMVLARVDQNGGVVQNVAELVAQLIEKGTNTDREVTSIEGELVAKPTRR